MRFAERCFVFLLSEGSEYDPLRDPPLHVSSSRDPSFATLSQTLLMTNPFGPSRNPKIFQNDFVIVTGASEMFFDRLQNLVGSFHFWEPGTKIIIYDLGLSKGVFFVH